MSPLKDAHINPNSNASNMALGTFLLYATLRKGIREISVQNVPFNFTSGEKINRISLPWHLTSDKSPNHYDGQLRAWGHGTEGMWM